MTVTTALNQNQMKSLEERLEYKFEKLQQEFQELKSINTSNANASRNEASQQDEYKVFLRTDNISLKKENAVLTQQLNSY